MPTLNIHVQVCCICLTEGIANSTRNCRSSRAMRVSPRISNSRSNWIFKRFFHLGYDKSKHCKLDCMDANELGFTKNEVEGYKWCHSGAHKVAAKRFHIWNPQCLKVCHHARLMLANSLNFSPPPDSSYISYTHASRNKNQWNEWGQKTTQVLYILILMGIQQLSNCININGHKHPDIWEAKQIVLILMDTRYVFKLHL